MILVVSGWLARRWVTSSALPAGTDMLGFVSRAAQNAHGSVADSLWSPANWGGRRTLTLESVLGLLTRAVGDPVVAVKCFAIVTLLAAGVFTYIFVVRVFNDRVAATTAGVLYLSSQGLLSHWASGHVNVEIAIATMPLMLLLWLECMADYSRSKAALLGAVTAITVFARPDLVLYIVPALVVVTVVRLVALPHARAILSRACRTTAVAAGVTLLLSLYMIVPAAAGIRASWLTSGALFDRQQLVDRSVDAYSSLLGFAREIGYLAFTNQQTWTGHPWLPFWAYAALATLPLALAVTAPILRGNLDATALLAAAAVTSFMAKGLRPPLGRPYEWAVQNVPVFGNLRDPNRWLLPQGLLVAVLAGVAVGAACRRFGTTGRFASVALVIASLVPVAPTLISGFRTVTVTSAQSALLARVAQDRTPSLVASIPYDETYRFVSAGGYHGWEHDLGAESAAFTGHAAVGDGGWDQRAADTVAYTETLLRVGDPAFGELLGSLGVRNLMSFGYPASEAHLLDANLGSMYQQRSAASMPGLAPVLSSGGSRLYRIDGFAPLVSFRPHVALVFGGRDGIAALADEPGVDLRQWAAFTADDILANGGIQELRQLARHAQLLVVANTRPIDVAVLATKPVASLGGITSDAGLDQRSQIVASDASVRLGALASQTTPPARIDTTTTRTTFRLLRARALGLWARIQTRPDAATLVFLVDGKKVASICPVTPTGGGFRWMQVATPRLSIGVHTLSVNAVPSAFGSGYELDEGRLLDPGALGANVSVVHSVVARFDRRTLYAFSPAANQSPRITVDPLQSSSPVIPQARHFWRPVASAELTNISVGRDQLLRLSSPRRFHTFAQRQLSRPLDLSGVDHIVLPFRGSGDGATYRLLLDFDRQHTHSVNFSFRDYQSGWRVLAFATPTTGGLAHVVSVRLARDDLSEPARIAVGPLRASTSLSQPIVLNLGQRSVTLHLSRQQLLVNRPVTVRPLAFAPAPQPANVSFTRVGATGYRFNVNASRPGVVMLAQAYDERWRMRSGGSAAEGTPVFGLATAFFVGPGRHNGSIVFAGNRYGAIGSGLSGLSALSLLCFGWWGLRRRVRR